MENTLVWTRDFEFTTYFMGGEMIPPAPRPELGSLAVTMDTKPPHGRHAGPTPKELVLAGVAGCSAMDVVSVLRKWKEPFTAFEITSKATQTTGGLPQVFARVDLQYRLEGEVTPEKAFEAVQLSQTKYCGVSAMISKSAEIFYEVLLNGKEIGKGKADFTKKE